MILERVDAVRTVAERAGEQGIVDWADRAKQDSFMLGRLRSRDTATLERLEETFNHEFYREYRAECERASERVLEHA